jgi:uncharacterized membrane protein YkoI
MKVAHLITLIALGAAVASPLAAQQAKTPKPKKENLKAMAKISKDSAKVIALSKVAAGSKVRSSELEREKGTIVYSFDIKVPKLAGVEEILVSAIDGSVVSQTHETPKQEASEKKAEKKPAKKS